MNFLRISVPVILLVMFAACSSSGGTAVTSPGSTAPVTTTGALTSRPSAEPLEGGVGQTGSAESSTPVTTAAPTVPASIGVTFVTVQGGSPGSQAQVSVLTAAEAPCSISYVDPAGTASTAQGLFDQRASRSGAVSWTWTIDTDTGPGTGSVTVTCNGVSATTPIQIR